MTIAEVNPGADRAGRTRRILGQAVKSALEDHGDGLAGFALVTWDMRGECHSSHLTEHGIVSEGLMPALVHDALNRHVAVLLTERAYTFRLPDPSA